MKTRIAAALICIALFGCNKPAGKEVKNEYVRIEMGSNYGLIYKVVVIDGNEYYATYVNRGWTLCPKLPPKSEK